jgi:hypothetical protein
MPARSEENAPDSFRNKELPSIGDYTAILADATVNRGMLHGFKASARKDSRGHRIWPKEMRAVEARHRALAGGSR